MSETPEKKVLREMLAELKAKTIGSEERFNQSRLDLYNKVIGTWKRLTELLEKKKIGKEVGIYLGLILRELHAFVDMSFLYSDTALEDFKIYLSALERYSSELDKTLTSIFERAQKIAEEQRKKQEELMKRKAPESYRV